MSLLSRFIGNGGPVDLGDGHHHFGWIVKCSRCGATDHILCNRAKPMPPEIIVQKFEQRGWTISKRAKEDMCSRCVEQETQERRAAHRSSNGDADERPSFFDYGSVIDAVEQFRKHVTELAGLSPGTHDLRGPVNCLAAMCDALTLFLLGASEYLDDKQKYRLQSKMDEVVENGWIASMITWQSSDLVDVLSRMDDVTLAKTLIRELGPDRAEEVVRMAAELGQNEPATATPSEGKSDLLCWLESLREQEE